MCVCTYLNSPLLLATRSGSQYFAELSNTTMWTVLVLLPLLVLTRHSQFPVKPGWIFEIVSALKEKDEGEISLDVEHKELDKLLMNISINMNAALPSN